MGVWFKIPKGNYICWINYFDEIIFDRFQKTINIGIRNVLFSILIFAKN